LPTQKFGEKSIEVKHKKIDFLALRFKFLLRYLIPEVGPEANVKIGGDKKTLSNRSTRKRRKKAWQVKEDGAWNQNE
jgi:hypothetical protein